MYKNVASQKLVVFAYDKNTHLGKTGDAANITGEISKDAGASAATDDAAPTELDATDHPGIYIFDPLQAETNADMLVVTAVSSTADVIIDPVIIYTRLYITTADINAEVDTALDTAIPGSPTADSINERIATIDDLGMAAGGGAPSLGD